MLNNRVLGHHRQHEVMDPRSVLRRKSSVCSGWQEHTLLGVVAGILTMKLKSRHTPMAYVKPSNPQ